MLTKNLELCRTGVHGQKGTVVTKQDLEEIVSTFVPKSAALTIWPHALADYAPALGTVDKVWLSDLIESGSTSLVGTVTMNDLLSDSYEKGLFPTWSIGSPRRASDNKRYLHHLKMCGAEPGAVKGLRDLGAPSAIKLSDCPEEDTFLLADPVELEKVTKPGNPGEANHKEASSMDDLEEAVQAITDPEKKKKAQALYDDLKKKAAATPPAKGPDETGPLKTEIERLKKQLSDLAAKYPEEAIQLSDTPSDPRVAELYGQLRKNRRDGLLKSAEGKVPKGFEKDLIALADSIPMNETIELADGKGKVSAFDLLEKILAGIPESVSRGEIVLSDPADPSKRPAPLASGLMGAV